MPLGGASVSIHAEEILNEEMEIRVVEEPLSNEPTTRVSGLQVELSEDPDGDGR
jgi:hypothetical protein